jgi:hypothetical protein
MVGKKGNWLEGSGFRERVVPGPIHKKLARSERSALNCVRAPS